MTLDGSLGIRVNGEHRRVMSGISVAEMLNELGLDPLRVAVERNLEIVPRSTYGEVALAHGDRLEIVHFIGGGNAPVDVPRVDKPFVLAGKTYKSRLQLHDGGHKLGVSGCIAFICRAQTWQRE